MQVEVIEQVDVQFYAEAFALASKQKKQRYYNAASYSEQCEFKYEGIHSWDDSELDFA